MTAATTFDVQSVRKDFSILSRQVNGHPLVYLDSGASAQKPDQVVDCIAHYYKHQHANIHRGVHRLSQDATNAYEQAREKVRAFINAPHDKQVIFTQGTTESINIVAACYGGAHLQAGDEVLISTLEHHSNIVPWQMICERTQATLRIIPINQAGEIIQSEYEKLLNEKTKIVAIGHVSNALGSIHPVKQMIAKAHQVGAVVCVDGAQAVPHMHIDVQDLDADFYAFSGHKMYGPTGVGVLYGKAELLDAMPPYQGGGEMIERVTFEKTTYNKIPFKFEAGTPNIVGGIGLGAAIDYMQQFDMSEVAKYEHELLAYATEKLSVIEGIKIYGTAENKASVLSFLLADTHPLDVGTILDQLGIAVRTGHHCTQPLMDFFGIAGTVRATFAMYNNKDDVDKLVAGVTRAASMLL